MPLPDLPRHSYYPHVPFLSEGSSQPLYIVPYLLIHHPSVGLLMCNYS